ncbi:hypothetical protein P691DRAFT_788861 [Macrolepiota fuliginosa MF-IS2]|uniref:Uncharacterized protein n=1 Tax=Macrolepiota fuliginosa MF-IS2 TaxID=1400762 RepID=A0A9P5X444_9AGAR|nr:hypothetical protein P691DRAFT_788861 [Macrolepiota fuliginosa MF-IS2]
MHPLTYLSLSLALGSALAAPVGAQYAIIGWVSESLKPFQQTFIDFINPMHPPSTNQTIIAYFVLILASAISAGPPLIPYPKDATVTTALRVRLKFFLYGFISPDYFTMVNWKERIEESCYASLYNKAFHKEDPKKGWSREHSAFAMKGGFVLWENNKPAKTLDFTELVRMIEAGEIEPPVISKEDIRSRTTRTPGCAKTVFLLYYSSLWLITKFGKSNIIALRELATLHMAMSWYSFLLHFDVILGVVEPVVITQKPREKSDKVMALEDNKAERERSASETLVNLTDGEDEIATELVVATANTTDRDVAVPDQVERNQSIGGAGVFQPLMFTATSTILNIFVEITSPLYDLVLGSIAPLGVLWGTISSPDAILCNDSGNTCMVGYDPKYSPTPSAPAGIWD